MIDEDTMTGPQAAELVPANQFVRCERNRQPREEAISKMAASVRDLGVLQPITARPVTVGEEQKLEIVMGECRWLGCCRIAEDYAVPVYVRPMDEKEAAKLRAVENFRREDLDAIEEALAIQHMKETGWKVEEIAEHVGRSKQSIYRSLDLLRLDEEAREAVREGQVSIRTGQAISELPEEMRSAALRAVVTPTHSAHALPQRDALRVIEREYAEPARAAKEWRARRKVLEAEHPGAVWVDYEEAVGMAETWKSGHSPAGEPPGSSLLTDRALEDKLAIPSWGELARDYGGRLVIGLAHDRVAACLYVERDDLMERVRQAFAERPEECLFEIEQPEERETEEEAEARRQREAESAERRREDRERFVAERNRAAQAILDGELGPKAERNLAAQLAGILFEEEAMEHGEVGEIFGVPLDHSVENEEEMKRQKGRVEKRVTEMIRRKEGGGFAALGRLLAVCEVRRRMHLGGTWSGPPLAELLITGGVLPGSKFPILAAAAANGEGGAQ